MTFLAADWICLLANTTADKPVHLNKSLIAVPMDTKGITLAKKIDKMGMRSSDTAEIYFEDVRVPAANIIGEEGMGFTYQMMQVSHSLPVPGNVNDFRFSVSRGKTGLCSSQLGPIGQMH